MARNWIGFLALVGIAAGTTAALAAPLTTVFSYQGQLRSGGEPLDGTADFEFTLWDSAAGGTQIGDVLSAGEVGVADGLFMVDLDFGALAFNGEPRWLEVAVRSPAGGGGFTTLAPRQPVSGAPYALQTRGMFVDDAGLVGIGTSAPAGRLHVSDAGPAMLVIEADTDNVNEADHAGILLSQDGGAVSAHLGYRDGSNTMEIMNQYNAALVLGAKGQDALRILPADGFSPNLIGGAAANSAAGDVRGATIAGGGSVPSPNTVEANFATVGGGNANTASGNYSAIAGGAVNEASGREASIGGGSVNTAAGQNARVGGGHFNTATGAYATIPGGMNNRAEGAASLAAGTGAIAAHDGAFVWADHSAPGEVFESTATDQFLIRADGGVGVGTNAPATPLHVVGGSDASATAGGTVQIGATNATNLVLDNNEIMARSNGAAGTLYLNADGGMVQSGGELRCVVDETWSTAMLGWATAQSSIGVYGWVDGYYSVGVKGVSGPYYGTGVYGVTTGWYGVGVYGDDPNSFGYAGYFDGDVGVSDRLTAGTKNFRIDHPLDPAGKYLEHGCVESDGYVNLYRGNATLDAQGAAWVQMPEWFSALNGDLAYQLTAIGAAMPELHVAVEVDGNRFRIAGGQPHGKVSWQVTGERQDPFAIANPLKVESDKPAEQQGRYLHPKLYGAPQNLRIRPVPAHETADAAPANPADTTAETADEVAADADAAPRP